MTLRSLIPNETTPRKNRLDDPFLLGGLFPPLAAPLGLQVRETEEAYSLRCELPGYEQDQVEVLLTGDLLELRAAPKGAPDAWGALPARTHSIRLTAPIDAQKIEAELRNGVLLVLLPKSEAARPRRIAVRAGRSQAQRVAELAGPPAAAGT